MKKLVLLLLFIGVNMIAQNRELGKVTIQELEEKVCPTDTSAVAAILFSVGEVHFEYIEGKGFVLNTNVITKIKIYKKEGYDWANKSVRYYIGGNTKERVIFKNEITYNLVNGKIEKSKIKSDGEFDEKENDFWGRKKISMPNVKVGSIIEFEYTIISESLGSLDEWYFQSSIPILYSEYRVYTPEFYTYTPVFKGFLQPKLIEGSKLITNNSTSKERSGWTNISTSFEQEKFSYNEVRKTYIIENVPALKEEAYVNNIRNYISSVVFELSGVKQKNQGYKDLSNTWEGVVKTIYDNDNFGVELNKTGYFEKDVDAILAGLIKPEEKLAALFNFVKSKMNWNEYYSYVCKTGVRKAYQEKTGNVAEINLMLTSMLRYAGFEANPVLLSTRSNGITLFPSRTAFDYVVVGVELNNQVVLLDATAKYSLPNILPIRDLNWFGRLIRKNGTSIEIDLMPKLNSKEMINLMAEINHQGEVTGKVRDQYFDYNAYRYRDSYNGVTKETMVEKIEKRHQGLEINDFDVQNNTELTKPIIENYSFTSNNLVEIIGDKMYFSPLFHFTETENPFKQETRLYPIDFIYPNQEKYSVSVKIPEGYSVESLPSSKAIGLPDDLGNFKYNISNTGNQIQLMFSFDINTPIISSDMYEVVKTFYKEMIAKQTEKIVLKKI